MRTAGFPCRAAGCDRSFQVADQSSMGSLTAASRARTDHEIAVHGYHHVSLADESMRGWTQRTGRKATGQK